MPNYIDLFAICLDEEGDGVNQCHLKKSLAKKKAMANMTSGEKDCPCRANKACQQPKADYWYGDIKTVKAMSPEECACQCERLNKCQVWTWVKGNKYQTALSLDTFSGFS